MYFTFVLRRTCPHTWTNHPVENISSLHQLWRQFKDLCQRQEISRTSSSRTVHRLGKDHVYYRVQYPGTDSPIRIFTLQSNLRSSVFNYLLGINQHPFSYKKHSYKKNLTHFLWYWWRWHFSKYSDTIYVSFFLWEYNILLRNTRLFSTHTIYMRTWKEDSILYSTLLVVLFEVINTK